MTTDDPMIPDAPASGTAVFVDGSGQRAKFIRRGAAIVVFVCLAYGAALLIAALTGVPIKGAILPYPALDVTTHSTHVSKAPQRTPGGPASGSAIGKAGASASSAASGSVTTKATPSGKPTRSTRPSTSPTPSAGQTTPTGTATKTRGKSSTAPGASNRPTSHPSKTAIHGHSTKG